ncbi:hypothetical protein HQ560_05915, partial [bacterium]|nr:hypothetical protein [bacterium]
EWRYHAAFVEPAAPSDRFRAFGWEPLPGRKHASAEAAFRKVEDASCEVAFLSPTVRAEVGMSDVYFRGAPFRRPVRHLRVVREGEGPLTLLTAFAPEVRLKRRGEGVFSGRSGRRRWALVLGAGKLGALRADGYLAVAAQEDGGAAEAYRFGGRAVTLGGAALPVEGEDVFVAIRAGKVVETAPTP